MIQAILDQKEAQEAEHLETWIKVFRLINQKFTKQKSEKERNHREDLLRIFIQRSKEKIDEVNLFLNF